MNYLNSILSFLLTMAMTLPAMGQGSENVKVATWNIEHLRAANGKGHIKRDDSDYERLQKYVERLDADVVALQEVEGEEAAERIFDQEEYDFFFSSRNNVMRTGFAVKKHLEVFQHSDFEALDVDGRGDLRYGTDITVIHGGDSLRLLSIHLKSGCFQNALSTSQSKSCKKLRRQLNILEDWIDARADETVPFVVLGDFNRRMGLEGDEFWAEIDDGVPANANLENVTEGRTSDCLNGKYPEFIDHIVLDARASLMLDVLSFEQILYEEEDEPFVEEISDHCPIAVRLELGDTSDLPYHLVVRLNEMETMVDSLKILIAEIRQGVEKESAGRSPVTIKP